MPFAPDSTAADAARPDAVFLLILVAITALGPLAMQIFLPALPAIQADFAVDPGAAQLVLSASMIAIAVATFVYGPLSDRFGRRPVMIAGLLIFMAGTALSVYAPTIETLIVGRVIQAAGATCGMVLARAIVRDVYAEERVASVLAYLTVAMVVAPMIAPAIGGLITDQFGWRFNFLAVGIVGVLVLYGVFRRLTETNAAPADNMGLSGITAGMGGLLRSARFNAYAFQGAFALSVFFCFASAAPYVMVDVLDRPAVEYGLYFILVAAGFMAGNFIAGRISPHYGVDRMVIAGSILILVSSVVLLVLVYAGVWSPWSIFLPATFGSLGSGFSMPNAQAGVLSVDPRRAGSASGLSGFMQMSIAAIFAQIVGMLQDGTPYPMAIMMTVAAGLTLGAVVVGLARARPSA